MILEVLGPDTGMLLIVGSAGGLVRGLVSLRKAAAVGPINAAAGQALLIDIGTSIVIGAACALFLHGAVQALFGPALELIHADDSGQVGTSGFIAGLVGITLIGLVLDTANIRAKLKSDAAAQPPDAAPQGGK